MKRTAVLALLLAALACDHVEGDRARDEATLRARLAAMRTAIATYARTHDHGPQALRDAMPSVPIDPLTHSATTWRLTTEENVQLDDFSTGTATARRNAIVDVHSGAAGRDEKGSRYSEY